MSQTAFDPFPSQLASRVAAGTAARWRLLTLAAILALTLAGWGYLVAAAVSSHAIPSLGPGMAALAPFIEWLGASLPHIAAGHAGESTPFGIVDLATAFAMWVAMVFAMMLPTAAPTLRAYSQDGPLVLFVGIGYLAVWIGAAAGATALQAGLVAGGALAPHMAPAGVTLATSVLIAAGVYQFTPLKFACLTRCRNPYAAPAIRGSAGSAMRLGLEEGIACLGCCWAMMAVMVAAGLMNLGAMALLGALMGLEKLVTGVSLTYGLGMIMLALGLGLAIAPFFG
jgi:predicted metal-binding membrane protein